MMLYVYTCVRIGGTCGLLAAEQCRTAADSGETALLCPLESFSYV